jgi:D-alanyl-D-alanine-carboxypeptidase/D-alanyl-D-alanine-endopeptidase
MPFPMTRRAWIASGAAAALAAETGVAASAQQSGAPLDLESIAAARLDGVPGLGIAIGTIEGGKTEMIVRGESDGSHKLDRDTVFEIGSVTKTFTATLLVEMVQAHEVALDDPIEKYLPTGAKAPTWSDQHVTLLDLATQNSGLPTLPSNMTPRNPTDPYADYTPAKLYEFLASYTLTRAPGTKYEYSNLGFGLLGRLLANRAGTSYDALVRKRIVQPLGMNATGGVATDIVLAHLAPGHDADGTRVHAWSFDALAGAGSLRSSLADMLKYLSANMNGTGPVADAMRVAQTPQRDAGTERIGLAWMTRLPSKTVWHNGATYGYASFIGFSGDRTRGIVILANAFTTIDDIGFHWLDPSFPLVRSYHAIAIDPKLVNQYEGRYALDFSRINPNAPPLVLVVSVDDGKLYAKLGDQPTFRIYPYGPDQFFYRIVDAQITFTLIANGKATGLVLHQNGLDIPAKRV